MFSSSQTLNNVIFRRPVMAALPLEPCEGNCVHGDVLYGNDPFAYDGSQCGCVRCPNFRLCGVWSPPVYLEINNGRCINCNASFRKNLVFTEHAPPVTCPICLDDKHCTSITPRSAATPCVTIASRKCGGQDVA